MEQIASKLLLVLLLASGLCFASTVEAAETAALQKVLKKLDAAADSSSVSGVTFEELEEAYREYKALDESTRQTLENQRPLYKLMVDVLINPIDLHREFYLDYGQQTKAAFIRRAELFYAKFKPAYLQQTVGNQLTKADKMRALIDSIMGRPGSSPLTLKMFRLAAAEYESYLRRIHEIRTVEDIYTYENELLLDLNLINEPTTRALGSHVFPRISSASIEELRGLFHEGLGAQGIKLIDGQFYRVG